LNKIIEKVTVLKEMNPAGSEKNLDF